MSSVFRSGPCVEFGAWDGISGSNTYNLISNLGYRGVLIEPDKSKFQELVSNLPDPKHHKIQAYVGLNFDNRLDSILERTEIPNNFDFLSIDIDGMDYYVWKSVEKYRPKIVCIEFNPTIPDQVFFIQLPDFELSQGASPLALISLATDKGYSLVSATDCNLIFVADELFVLVTGSDQTLAYREVAPPRIVKEIYIFSGYDGTILLSDSMSLPWHKIEIGSSDLQILPKRIRKFPLNYTNLDRIHFLIFKFAHRGLPWGLKHMWGKFKIHFSR